jgi:hypothetical protein
LPGYDEVGFKTVKATRRDVELCCRAWPHATKLLLFREPGATYGSLPEGWREAYDITPTDFSAKWNSSAAAFLDHAREHKDCHLIDYDSVVRKEASLSLLLKVANLDPSDAEAVLALRLNSTPERERASEADISFVQSRCHDLYARLLSNLSVESRGDANHRATTAQQK